MAIIGHFDARALVDPSSGGTEEILAALNNTDNIIDNMYGIMANDSNTIQDTAINVQQLMTESSKQGATLDRTATNVANTRNDVGTINANTKLVLAEVKAHTPVLDTINANTKPQ